MPVKTITIEAEILDPPFTLPPLLTDVTDIINWHLISINQYLINIRFVMKTTVNFLQFYMNHAQLSTNCLDYKGIS